MKYIKLAFFLLLFSVACSKKDSDSAKPVITSLSIAKGSFDAAVSILGKNFSTTASNNIVKFNGKPAVVNTATRERLDVIVPKGAGTGIVTVEVNGEVAQGPSFEYVLAYVVSTLVGNGGASFVDGQGTAASIYSPISIAIASDGSLVVGSSRVSKIDANANLTTIAGGTQGYAEGNGAAAQFQLVLSLATDGAGNIYVSDGINHRIRKIDASKNVTTYSGTGANGYLDGNAATAILGFPAALVRDNTGNIYFADGRRIRKIDGTGTVTTIAGSGTQGHADGNGVNATFTEMVGMAMDASGNLYVSDRDRVRKIDAARNVTTIAPGLFSLLSSLAIDSQNNIYVTDTGNTSQGLQLGVLYIITPTGNVSVVAGSTVGFADGVGLSASFSGISGIAIDAAGTIYITDASNNRVRKVTIQ